MSNSATTTDDFEWPWSISAILNLLLAKIYKYDIYLAY